MSAEGQPDDDGVPRPEHRTDVPEDQPSEVVDDGEVPEKQIQRWKNEGGAYLVPPDGPT